MYSSDEIQGAVERLVRGSIRRPVDPLGVRRVDIAYSDVQEAGATVLLLNAAGPFYCLALGAQRLRDAVQAEALILDSLLDAILATGRRVLPIESVDSLFNAKAALQELETAAASRSQGFKDISKVPSYQRFNSSVQSFLDGPAQNIKSNGNIVETPQQARVVIPTLLRQLAASHADLVLRATSLAGGIDDFKAVNLPALVASGAISRARQVIGAHADALDALSKEDRLLQVRDVALDVLASKAVVRQFGSFTGPTEFYSILGTGGPYADSSHPAIPASLTSLYWDAVTITAATKSLDVSLDASGPVFEINLDPSILATINQPLVEMVEPTIGSTFGWRIGDGTSPSHPSGATTPNNDELRVDVDGTTYSVPLTVSATFASFRSAQQVCDDINAVLPAGVRAQPIFAPLEYSGPFDIDAGMGTSTFHVPAGASDLVALGVKAGDLVKVLSGANAGLYPVAGVTTTTLVVTGTFVLQVGAPSEVGPKYRKIQIACVDPATQVPLQTKLTLLADTIKSRNACDTLGFFPGIYSQCLRTTMDQVAEQINTRTNQIVATTVYAPLVSGIARSSVTNAAKVIFDVPFGAAEYSTLRINDGPNKGDYLIQGQGATAFELILKTNLPQARQGFDPVTFSASFGLKRLVLTGKTTTLASKLSIAGTAATTFYSLVPAVAFGTTNYFQLPQTPAGLQVGDSLELNEDTYNVASAVYDIEAVEPGINVIQIAPPISTHLPPSPPHWVFGDQPPPFARVRVVKTFDFTTFQTRLRAWLAMAVNQESYFTELNRHVNPLLVNETPTAAQVGDAKNSMLVLYDALTETRADIDAADPALTIESALVLYAVAPVPAVDTLLKSYKEKGSTRAVDLLLSGKFGEFFGLSLDDASYSGAMQSAMREVAREDLAVRKVSRVEGARQLSQGDSPDYDFDRSDIEHGAEVDPP